MNKGLSNLLSLFVSPKYFCEIFTQLLRTWYIIKMKLLIYLKFKIESSRQLWFYNSGIIYVHDLFLSHAPLIIQCPFSVYFILVSDLFLPHYFNPFLQNCPSHQRLHLFRFPFSSLYPYKLRKRSMMNIKNPMYLYLNCSSSIIQLQFRGGKFFENCLSLSWPQKL